MRSDLVEQERREIIAENMNQKATIKKLREEIETLKESMCENCLNGETIVNLSNESRT